MNESRAIRWKMLLAEVPAIVVGILLAFAIDAWWEQRTEAARTRELLVALEVEWSAELDRIAEHLDQYERTAAGTIRFLDAHVGDAAGLSPQQAADIVLGMGRWSTFKPSVAAYNVILDYRLDQIDAAALRHAVASWQSVLAEVAPEQDALHELALLPVRSELSRIAHDFELPWRETPDSPGFASNGIDPGAMALASIRDHGLARTQRHMLNLLNQYRRQLTEVRETLRTNLAILRANVGRND